MSALDRLRAREIFGEVVRGEPTKPTKGASVGFVGTSQGIPFIYSSSANDEPNANVGEFADQYAHAENIAPIDPDVERRRSRALAMLDERPKQRIAIVAEPGDPAYIAVAIRGVTVGELEIPAERYDAFALLALMQKYGHA